MLTTFEGGRLDVDNPRWDQGTFVGRLLHFANVTDPRTAFVPRKQLQEAKELLSLYKAGREPATTTHEQVIRAQKLYQSAFHPDTGDLLNVLGRMSFAVPSGMALTGALLAFHKTNAQVIFWQWVNQSYMAFLNYTNRNAKSPVTTQTACVAYLSATSTALVVSLGLKAFLHQRAGPLAQRLVPFAAVAAANCVNVPLMRQSEIRNGIYVSSQSVENDGWCMSRLAAGKAITLVVISRLVMAAPAMIGVPFIMERLETVRLFQRYRTALNAPIQTILSGAILLFMIPIGCALFPQQNRIRTSWLRRFEPSAYTELMKNGDGKVDKHVYFNKGL